MSPRVLVVDDNPELSATIAQILRLSTGAKVDCAHDGQSGLAWADRHGFDVAIVDVKLPDAVGVDLIRPLRSLCPQAEVIIMTGHATVDTAIGALREGAFAFLLKSFRPEELVAAVEQALAKVQLKEERGLLERRHRALIEGADVLVVGLYPDERLCVFNPRAASLAKIWAPDVLGKPFIPRFVASADAERFRRAFREAARADRAVEVETGYLDSAGGTARVRWHLSGVRDPKGVLELVYGIGLDVTERRLLERRAADAEALAAMGSLTLGLAHEIRNPLNAAVLTLQLLRRAIAKLPDEHVQGSMRERVQIVEDEIGRVGRLLNDFLELARPKELKREAVDLAQLLRGALDLHGEALAAQQVEVALQVPSEAPFFGDPEKLRVVFSNLIANALDAMSSGGKLAVTLRVDATQGCVEVADSGPGIDPTILSEVFAPFFTTKEAGTGLGLSIVRKIVDQHKGRISIDSNPGAGTRVKLELPCAS